MPLHESIFSIIHIATGVRNRRCLIEIEIINDNSTIEIVYEVNILEEGLLFPILVEKRVKTALFKYK